MRVLIVLGPLELGGSERQALILARYLSKDHHVEVWGTSPGKISTLCDEYGIAWKIVPLPDLTIRSLLWYARRMRTSKPDVILPYMALPNLVCGLVWRLTGAKTCVWNQRDDGIARIKTKYERLAVRLTPKFIANSNHGAEYLTKTLGAKRVHVVRNGVELSPTPEPHNGFVACMIGNLSRYKDHRTLLKAWRLVIDKVPATLLLAGRFDETTDELKALAFDLDLKRSVRFLGQVEDISGLLRGVDLGVFCSNSEGSPNGVLECMAAGLPVVGTDIPALRELLDPNLLIPPNDSDALASTILALINSPEVRARQGELNRIRVQEFGKERMCEETMQVICRE